MKYKLTNYVTHGIEEVTTGTCEMCMSTRNMEKQYFYIQDENGGTHEVPGFSFIWGDLDQVYIDNIPHFAQWLENTDIDPPIDKERGYNYSWFAYDIVGKYEYEMSDEGQREKRIYNNINICDNTIVISCNDEFKEDLLNYTLDELFPYADNDGSLIINEDTRFKTDKEWILSELKYSYLSTDETLTKVPVNICSLSDVTIENDNAVYLGFNGYDKNESYVNTHYIEVGTFPCEITIKIQNGNNFPVIFTR